MERDRFREDGQGAIEYALIFALIAGVVALALALMGVSVRDVYCDVMGGMGKDVCSVDLTSWKVRRGKWSLGEPMCNKSSGQGSVFADGYTGKDAVITIDSAKLSRGNGYGVYFRATNVNKRLNGYTFQYDPGYGGGAFIIRKWVHGHELPPLAVKKDRNFPWHGSDNKIQLKIVGDTFTVFVNGEQVLVGKDDTYKEGGIGLRTWDSTRACFKGISVKTP